MARNKNDGGWIKLHRRLFESELWLAGPFDRAHAWVDLIGLAAFEDRKVLVGSRCKIIHRGQIRTSYAELAERWNWSKKQVMVFLMALSEAEMCHTEGNARGTTLTIVNYEFYQGRGNARGNTEGNTEGTLRERSGNAEETTFYYMKNDKKGRREEAKRVANCTESGDNSAPLSPAPTTKTKAPLPDWLSKTVSALPGSDRYEAAMRASEGDGDSEASGFDEGELPEEVPLTKYQEDWIARTVQKRGGDRR